MKALITKFLSRRLAVLGVFGVGLPLMFHHNGVPENVTLAAIALAATYMGQRMVKG